MSDNAVVGAALAALQAKVGQEVHVSDWMTITQDRISQFAKATDDHQWIHVDAERAAKESPYGKAIAHGYLSRYLSSFRCACSSMKVNPTRTVYVV